MTNLATESALLFDPRLKPIMITIIQMISPNSFVCCLKLRLEKRYNFVSVTVCLIGQNQCFLKYFQMVRCYEKFQKPLIFTS